MNSTIRTMLLVTFFSVLGLHGAESVVWDTVNNTVTYTVSIDDILLNGSSETVYLSQFNAATAATEEGSGTAANYTLTSVVMSLDGTIVGNVTFYNTGETSGTPKLLVTGEASLSYGSYSTGTETFYQNTTYDTLSAGDNVSYDFSVAGSGKVSTSEITSDLQSFTGSSTIATDVTFPGDVYTSFNGTSGTADFAATGSATVSITYYYEEVPEPTSMAFLTLGLAAILGRRKIRRPFSKG